MQIPSLDKVLFKPDEKVFVINPPKGAPQLPRPAKAIDLADAVLLWATREAHLPKYSEPLGAVPPEAVLWVCYPKPGKLETDLGRDKLWMFMKGKGFVPVRVVSVDDTWSAFSFKR
jgi:hypothetical protein